jgi:c-di-GMP-binding flagellar brake protein YcgR
MRDKRAHPRLNFGIRVEGKDGKKSWMTEDISAGGCFVNTLENLPIGSKIDIVFQVPGSSMYIEARGQVKQLRKGGMGIEFVALEPEQKDEIKHFVQEIEKLK